MSSREMEMESADEESIYPYEDQKEIVFDQTYQEIVMMLTYIDQIVTTRHQFNHIDFVARRVIARHQFRNIHRIHRLYDFYRDYNEYFDDLLYRDQSILHQLDPDMRHQYFLSVFQHIISLIRTRQHLNLLTMDVDQADVQRRADMLEAVLQFVPDLTPEQRARLQEQFQRVRQIADLMI
jgi:hypothetical protein